MYHDRLLHLADVIEAGAIQGLGFNQGSFSGDATEDFSGRALHGRAGCMANWAVHVATGHTQRQYFPDTIAVHNAAASWLGLSRDESNTLFSNARPGMTPAGAAKMLRHTAKIRDVDWSIIESYAPKADTVTGADADTLVIL